MASLGSVLPVGFWYLARGTQEKGGFVRLKGEVRNEVLRGWGYAGGTGVVRGR